LRGLRFAVAPNVCNLSRSFFAARPVDPLLQPKTRPFSAGS
jgi:hypothetical protein